MKAHRLVLFLILVPLLSLLSIVAGVMARPDGVVRADPVPAGPARPRLGQKMAGAATPTPLPAGRSPLAVPTAAPAQPIPQVIAVEPVRYALIGDLHVPLVLSFDGPVPSVAPALTFTPTVAGDLSRPDATTLVFTPDPGWAPGTRYEVTLGDWRTILRTPRVLESFSPGRLSNVAPQRTISIRFGVPVDQASVESAFTLSPTVAGRLHWTDERSLLFEPEEGLEYLTRYVVAFNGELRDAAAMPLPPEPGWEFSTRSALVSVAPKASADVDAELRLEFDTPMDQKSVEASLVITPHIPGTFSWQGNSLTLSPEDYLDPETTYRVLLQARIRDASGRRLLENDDQWQFTTRPIPQIAAFGWGPKIQVLDAAGARSLPLQSYASRHVRLRLYSLDIPRFLARYTSSFRGIGPAEDKPVETGDLPLVLDWEQDAEKRDVVAIPADVPPGMYVLEAWNGPGRDQIIVVLTRHVLVLKQAGGQIVTWASSIDTHAPAVGMHLSFYDRDGTLVAEGGTEERGLHRVVVPTDPQPLLVIGELDGDLTVSGLSNEWQQGWGWWSWWQNSPQAAAAAMYAYTDRPIYRPGQTVHARAVIRRDADAVYSLPDGEEVLLRLRDARDNVIATRQLTPDSFGAVYADFEIAAGGTVGTYNLEVSALGETARQSFLVEAYRKPDYEVTLAPAHTHVVAGEPLTVTLEARYFFGQPVSGAKVEVVPYVAGYDGYNEWAYDGCCGSPALNYGYAYEKSRRVGRTDAQGRFTVTLPAELTNGRDEQIWNLEASVTDASDQSVSGHARVIVHRAAYGLGLTTEHMHYHPGDPIPVTVVALDHEGAPAAGAALDVGLYRWDRETREYSLPAVQVEAVTDATGRAEVLLQTARSDWFQLRADAADAAGRPMQATGWIWIYNADLGLWDSGDDGQLRLSTDRERYAPGDVVELLIESPLAGPALLSFERGTTRRETVIQVREGLNRIEFELLPDDVPNIHVALALWQPTDPREDQWDWQSRPEAELLTAQTEILVPADDRRLAVTITPDRSEYAPRDEATLLVEIRDAAGRPVRAGFSLALVDEAIFSLAADQTPHIFDAFYQPRADLVRTYHSLRPTRWLDGMGGGGGGGEGPAGSPRSDFPDTAFWAPALETGADGRALVQVPLPDSLTRWRAVVRAVTPDTRVGQATGDITVALPLSIQPVLPRFLVQGDTALLTAVVHNHTGVTRTAMVGFSADGLALPAGVAATQSITLPAHGTASAGWPVTADTLGELSVRMDVTMQDAGRGVFHDAVVLPLPVSPRAVPQVTTLAREVEGEWSETVTLPADAIPDLSRWELSLAPSIASGMLDGLEFLIDYPFG